MVVVRAAKVGLGVGAKVGSFSFLLLPRQAFRLACTPPRVVIALIRYPRRGSGTLLAFSMLVIFQRGVLAPIRRKRRVMQMRRHAELPVAALDENFKQLTAFIIKSVAESSNVSPELCATIATLWTETAEASQLVWALLLSSMRVVDRNLHFWSQQQRSLNRATQRWLFLLLRRGPVSFVKDVLSLIGVRSGEMSSVREPEDVISLRVTTLKAIQRGLAEALHLVHVYASMLYDVGKSGKWEETGYHENYVVQQPLVPLLSYDCHQMERASELPLQATNAALACCQGLQKVVEAVKELSQLVQNNLAIVENILVEPDIVNLVKKASLASFVIVPRNRGEGNGNGNGEEEEEEEEESELHSVRRATVSISDTSYHAKASLLYLKTEKLSELLNSFSASIKMNTAECMRGKDRGMPLLVYVPQWCYKPSSAQRGWINTTVKTLFGLRIFSYMYMHSWLSGSDDIERWTRQGLRQSKEKLSENIVTPLGELQSRLFSKVEAERRDVTSQQVTDELDSLDRMVAAFNAKYPDSRNVGGGGGEGMKYVMRHYEKDVQSPLKGVLSGNLATAILIQGQKMKADSQALLFEVEKILKTNELTLAMMAAIPAMLVLSTGLLFLWRQVTPSPPDPTVESAPSRLLLSQLQSHLIVAATSASQERNRNTTNGALDSSSSSLSSSAAYSGHTLYKASLANEAVVTLYRHHYKYAIVGDIEYKNLKHDFQRLVAPISNEERIKLIHNMQNSYRIFK